MAARKMRRVGSVYFRRGTPASPVECNLSHEEMWFGVKVIAAILCFSIGAFVYQPGQPVPYSKYVWDRKKDCPEQLLTMLHVKSNTIIFFRVCTHCVATTRVVLCFTCIFCGACAIFCPTFSRVCFIQAKDVHWDEPPIVLKGWWLNGSFPLSLSVGPNSSTKCGTRGRLKQRLKPENEWPGNPIMRKPTTLKKIHRKGNCFAWVGWHGR